MSMRSTAAERSDLHIDMQDSAGYTAGMVAARAGHACIVGMLQAAGAFPIAPSNFPSKGPSNGPPNAAPNAIEY